MTGYDMGKMFRQSFQKDLSPDRFFLERPCLDKLLEKALQSHLVTVVAGEGSGKTHAIHSFLQKDPRSTVWIQLSERDNITWRFWENCVAETALVNPEIAEIFADIGFPKTERLLDRYFTAFKNKIIINEQYVIVLDDFHLLTDPSILLFLERILAAPISKNTLVLISRTEPAINTVSLLSKGICSRITAEDLRFTEEEIAEYFRRCGIQLNAEEVSGIYRDTEGWALAVDLILRGYRGGGLRAGDRRWNRIMKPIREMEESLFSTMEGDLRKFLIKLSLIEHWPRSLLEILDPGGKNIAAMEQFGSFVRFDVYLHGFRIHQLFLDLLRKKQGELSQEEIRDVYRKSAQWCMENKLPTDAAVDYERARDYGGLIRLIDSLPRLLSTMAAAFYMETVERMVPGVTDQEEDGDRLFLWFIVRPRLLTLQGHFEESAGESQKAIARFEASAPGPLRSRILAAACNNMGTLGILTCRFTKDYNFASWFERGSRYAEHPEPFPGRTVQCGVGSYAIQAGDPVEAGEIERSISGLARAVSWTSVFINGYLYGADTLCRAEFAYYQADLNNAEKFARQTIYQGREKKQYEVENRGLFYLMRICIHTGNLQEIPELRRQLEAQLEIPEYLNRYTIYDIGMGRFYAQIGQTHRIASWIRNEFSEGELNDLFHNFDVLVKAWRLFVEKQYSRVLGVLKNEKARRVLEGFLLGKLEITVLEAVTYYHLGEKERALKSLEEAYRMAALDSLDMPFIEMGEDMRLFAGAVLSAENSVIPQSWLESIRNRASAYSKKLLLAAKQYQEGEEERKKPPIYLTSREKTVLWGLSQGLTRETIADQSGFSLNTVKVIISALYDKFGAVNRADAIRIATEKGLLNDPG
jgi:LuxR family maltose regulon positive regulatory protein